MKLNKVFPPHILFLGVILMLLTGCRSGVQDNWVTLTSKNQGQTASTICQDAGFSKAISAKRCDETIYTFPDTFIHENCKSGATRYQDCFDFYACSILDDPPDKVPGVVFEAIYCE